MFMATEAHITQISNIDLRSLTELKLLNLSYNDITELSPFIFEWAANLDTVDLSHNQIAHISDNAFEKRPVQSQNEDPLDYYDDSVATTTRRSPVVKRQHSNIEELYLNDNKLAVLKSPWFQPLTKLRVLNVDGNFLKTVDFNDVLKFNVLLTELHAGRNYFEEISDISLDSFVALRRIDLSNNPVVRGWDARIDFADINISSMRVEGCRISWKTQVFDATWNNITNVIIDRVATDGTSQIPQLRNLNLAHNQISSVVNITDLPNLISLDLSYNVLEVIAAGSFDRLNNLKSLQLKHNNLRDFDYGVLRGMGSLSYLHLSFNRLQKFYLQNLLNELTSVDLFGNNITNIDFDLKRKAPKLSTIYAGENNWDCNTLTTAVLALNIDNIRLLASSNPLLINQGEFNSSVRGIGCHGTTKPQVQSTTNNVSISSDVKAKIETLIDEKIHEFETRLMDVIANLTNQNMKEIVKRLDELTLQTNLTQVP